MTDALVQPYNPDWPDWFTQICAVLEAALDSTHLTIEHVGSTSVPGLAAKAIIDIDIIIAADQFEAVKAKLAQLGYNHQGDLGVTGREAFGLADDQPLKANLPAHHLYVCPHGSPELKRHRFFRDYLRRNQQACHYYGRKKFQIAELCDHDRKMYAEVKAIVLADFFENILGEMD